MVAVKFLARVKHAGSISATHSSVTASSGQKSATNPLGAELWCRMGRCRNMRTSASFMAGCTLAWQRGSEPSPRSVHCGA